MILKNSGYSLIEVMITLSIRTIVMLAVLAILAQTAKIQGDLMTFAQIQIFKNELLSNLSNNIAWRNTVLHGGPAAMNCLAYGTYCTVDGSPQGTPIHDRAFAVFDPAGQVFFDATNPANGIDIHGRPCPGFSLSPGNASCPFRYDLKWSASCIPGSYCMNPIAKITGDLLYSPGPGGTPNRRNLKKYSIGTIYATRLSPRNFGGSIAFGDYCPNCALEDRNEMQGGLRFLLNNDQASINRRCKELGYNWGVGTSFFSSADWCGTYVNARTKVWNGTSWIYGPCIDGNVSAATCYL